MGALSGWTEAYLGVDLPPGEYVLVCLVEVIAPFARRPGTTRTP